MNFNHFVRSSFKPITYRACLFLSGLLCTGLLFTGLLFPNSVMAVELDQPAPDFTLKSISGENLRLEELRGKVVLINFWASWCGPCRQEMPILDRIHQRYEPTGFSVLGVNVESDPTKARKIAERTGVEFPLVLDQKQQVSKAYNVEAMPYTVLVDRDGKVRYIHAGYKPGDEQKYINRLKKLLR